MDAITFFFALVVLQLLDALTTYRGIKQGNSEANPIFRFAFKKLGVKTGLLLAKVGLLVFFWFHPVVDVVDQALILGAYLLTVLWNLRVIKKSSN